MVSQVQGFVHLLATAPDGGHEPQVFRMRWDQPLRRFARAYALFRELGDDAIGGLRMLTKSHGELDPAATASVYGLTDGDAIVFSGLAAVGGTATAPKVTSGAVVPFVEDRGHEAWLEKASQGQQKLKLAGRGRARPSDTSGRGPSQKTAGKTTASQGVLLKAKVATAKGLGAKAKAKAKAKSKVKASTTAFKSSRSPSKAKKLADCAGGAIVPATSATCSPLENEGEPDVPRCLKFGKNATIGPAKGWRLVAWLQDVSGPKAKKSGSVVRWRAITPDRTKQFGSFQTLKNNVGEGVYTQLSLAVRPEILKKITEKRMQIESRYIRKRKCTMTSDATFSTPAPLSKKRRPLAETPTPLRNLATQLFDPIQEPALLSFGKSTWNCSCEGHFKRHTRCVRTGNLQPSLVHLRETMTIGRGEACDLVLDSRRTPQMVSRCHAKLDYEDRVFYIADQGSLNGILINGMPATGKTALVHRDVITFGVPTPHPEFDYIFEVRPDPDDGTHKMLPPVKQNQDHLMTQQM